MLTDSTGATKNLVSRLRESKAFQRTGGLSRFMRLVEIFLPLRYGDGQQVPGGILELVKQELADKFGGVTAYSRGPAEGLWKDGRQLDRDAVVVLEVVADKLDKAWWKDFRERLELLLRQKEVLIRASHTTKL